MKRPDLASYGLCALCVLGIVALAVSHQPIPDVLTYIGVGALGIGGGASLPTGSSAAVPAASSPAVPAPRAAAAAPLGATRDPAATGVFRAVPPAS